MWKVVTYMKYRNFVRQVVWTMKRTLKGTDSSIWTPGMRSLYITFFLVTGTLNRQQYATTVTEWHKACIKLGNVGTLESVANVMAAINLHSARAALQAGEYAFGKCSKSTGPQTVWTCKWVRVYGLSKGDKIRVAEHLWSPVLKQCKNKHQTRLS